MITLLTDHDRVARPIGDVGEFYLAEGEEDTAAADSAVLAAAALAVAVSLRIGPAQVHGSGNSRIGGEHLLAVAVLGAVCKVKFRQA